MGNNTSKGTRPASSFPVRRWPTAGNTRADIQENVNYVRQDVDRWYRLIASDHIDATTLNEDVVYRFINRLWKHIEQTAEDHTARHYQRALQEAYDYIAAYSRGKPVKADRARRRLRLDLMLCALELTAAVLVLQQGQAEGYQRRRQSLPIMAWAMVDCIINTQDSEVDATTPWCGGLITRIASSGEWNWQRGNMYTKNRSIDSLSEGEALLLLAVDMRKGTLDWAEQDNQYDTLRGKGKLDAKVGLEQE